MATINLLLVTFVESNKLMPGAKPGQFASTLHNHPVVTPICKMYNQRFSVGIGMTSLLSILSDILYGLRVVRAELLPREKALMYKTLEGAASGIAKKNKKVLKYIHKVQREKKLQQRKQKIHLL